MRAEQAASTVAQEQLERVGLNSWNSNKATASAGSTVGPGGAGRGECQVREHAHKDTGSHVHCQLEHPWWDMFHLIRSISLMKGLFTRLPGHMAHNRARNAVASRDRTVIRIASTWRARNEFELLGVLPRTGPVSTGWQVAALSGLVCCVKVYADLNTFRIGLGSAE